MLCKKIADDILKELHFFFKKICFDFHTNCLLRRQFARNVKANYKITIIKFSSAESNQSVMSLKTLLMIPIVYGIFFSGERMFTIQVNRLED